MREQEAKTSEVPETDALREKSAGRVMQFNDLLEYSKAQTLLCEKLERQRNAAWKTLKEIREAVTADADFGSTVEVMFATPLKESEHEIERLSEGIDCAVNALTDSILCSGNDAATNMHFVRKLKALLSQTPTPTQPDA